MNFPKRTITASSIATAIVLLCTSAYSPVIGDTDDKFTLNLKDSDVHALIATVSEATGRNFVVDPRVSGRVTVVSKTPVNAEKLYGMFLSVLQVHGFSAVPAGDLIKIVPDFAAKQGPVPVLGEETETRDQLVSQVIPIIHVPADPLVQILRPMVPQEGQLAAYPASNSLIVTDRAANIERLMKIIKLIDIPDSDEVDIVRLNHASAADVLQTLAPLQRANAANSPGSMQLVADNRTNSILVSGNQAVRNRVRGLINELDSPIDSGGNTQVVFLQYADAEEIASILLTGNIGSVDQVSSTGQQQPVAVASDPNDLDAGVQSFDPFVSGTTSQAEGPRVDIKTDSNTNSLIITATPADMATLLAIIERLDIRRPQVMVEAVIAEVSNDNIRELGINFLVDGLDSDGPAGITNLGGQTDALVGAIGAGANGLPTSVPSGLSLALGNFANGNIDFGLLFRAIASDADNNILSTPTIVTLDNEEAEIVVGSNVPFITGQQLGGDNDNPFQTIEREDIGLRLMVKPQINEGDTIKLELEQEVSSVNATALAGAADITTSTRSITTTVLVEDGQTLVLGGLNDDSITEVVEKVPLLGDIPVVGRLFQYKSKTNSKTSLMIFLRPVIMRTADAADRVSNERYNETRSQRMLFDRNSSINVDINSSEEDSPLPEIQVFNASQAAEVDSVGSPVNHNADTKLEQPVINRRKPIRNRPTAADLDLEGNGYEWVEMPDGSLVLKQP